MTSIGATRPQMNVDSSGASGGNEQDLRGEIKDTENKINELQAKGSQGGQGSGGAGVGDTLEDLEKKLERLKKELEQLMQLVASQGAQDGEGGGKSDGQSASQIQQPDYQSSGRVPA